MPPPTTTTPSTGPPRRRRRGSTARRANSVAGVGVGPHITNVLATPAIPNANQAVDGLRNDHRTDLGSGPLPDRLRRRADDRDDVTRWRQLLRHASRRRGRPPRSAIGSRPPTQPARAAYPAPTTPSAGKASSLATASPPRCRRSSGSSPMPTTTRSSPTRRADITRQAVVSYNGTVIDNVSVNIRGQNSQDVAEAQLEVRDAAQPTHSTSPGSSPTLSTSSRCRLTTAIGRTVARRWPGTPTRPPASSTRSCSSCARRRTASSSGCTPTWICSTTSGATARGMTTSSSSSPRPSASHTEPPIDARWEKKNPGDEDLQLA